MNPLIIYVAIIVIGLFVLKVFIEKLLKFISEKLDSTAKSTSTIAIFIGITLIVYVYLKPDQAEIYYHQLRMFIQSLL